MSVSIKDVARIAGVSVASVSRVVTGSPGVGKETAHRIRKAMEEIDYRPNLGARGLVKRQTGNIAVVFPRGSSFILGNPFFSRVLEGIAPVLDQTHHNTLISFTSQQQKRLLETRAVDGVILFAPRDGELSLEWLKQTLLPIVVVGSYLKDSPFPCVRPDDEGGIRTGVHALYNLGHRRIGLVNGPVSSVKSQRCLEGYRLALSELGLEFQQKNVLKVSEYDAVKAAGSVSGYLANNNKLTGVVCSADFLAMGVIKGASQIGLSVPKDLSVVGFGDVPFSEFFIPALSTIHVDLVGVGCQAALLLADIINGKTIRKKERVFHMEYIARETCCPPQNI